MEDTVKLRQGRKVGRNLYAQLRDRPSDEDVPVGQVDSPELATPTRSGP